MAIQVKTCTAQLGDQAIPFIANLSFCISISHYAGLSCNGSHHRERALPYGFEKLIPRLRVCANPASANPASANPASANPASANLASANPASANLASANPASTALG